MKIGIIGSGNIGLEFAGEFTKKRLSSRFVFKTRKNA
jgi:predicted dinucleotide-binding enzyme